MIPGVASLDQFPLDAEISLTEFRSEDTVTSRLRHHHRLRVRRRGDLIGVFLDVDAWRGLVRYVESLEADAEERESEIVRAIVDARAPNAEFRAGSPDVVTAIDEEYGRLVQRRERKGGRR